MFLDILTSVSSVLLRIRAAVESVCQHILCWFCCNLGPLNKEFLYAVWDSHIGLSAPLGLFEFRKSQEPVPPASQHISRDTPLSRSVWLCSRSLCNLFPWPCNRYLHSRLFSSPTLKDAFYHNILPALGLLTISLYSSSLYLLATFGTLDRCDKPKWGRKASHHGHGGGRNKIRWATRELIHFLATCDQRCFIF